MGVHKRYSALGRGLDALISTDDVRPQGSSTINEIEISKIEANPNQPRREFDQEALQELANSIREIGIIQPITLRQVAEDRYQIIAGERRWRASQIAGLTAIPAYIRTIKDENVMEMALGVFEAITFLPTVTSSPLLSCLAISSTFLTEYPFFCISLNTFICSDGESIERSARACPMSISFFCNAICTCAGSFSSLR